MTMSMHWITQDWSLKTHILGMINFLEDHTTVNFSETLMDLHLEFGVYHRNCDDETPHYPDAVRIDKLVYFRFEPRLDRPMLINDCGSDVSVGVEKDKLWDRNRFCHAIVDRVVF